MVLCNYINLLLIIVIQGLDTYKVFNRIHIFIICYIYIM